MHAKATEVAEVWFDAANAADMTAERKWSPDFVADKNTAERRAVRKPSPHGSSSAAMVGRLPARTNGQG
jgi:hypothetical protein